jgi:CRP-like cAMP-binding protein
MDDVSIAIKQLREERRFFHLFTQEELALLFPLFGKVHYAAKSTIFSEDETANVPFFVVYNGALEIYKKTDFGRPYVLARVKRGALMGQISLTVSDNKASVSAATIEVTELLMMSADRVSEVLEKHPSIGIKMLKEIIRVQNIRMSDLVSRMASTL